MACRRTGDVVVSARLGWEFADAGGHHHAGGGSHGSLRAEDSLVPLITAGFEARSGAPGRGLDHRHDAAGRAAPAGASRPPAADRGCSDHLGCADDEGRPQRGGQSASRHMRGASMSGCAGRTTGSSWSATASSAPPATSSTSASTRWPTPSCPTGSRSRSRSSLRPRSNFVSNRVWTFRVDHGVPASPVRPLPDRQRRRAGHRPDRAHLPGRAAWACTRSGRRGDRDRGRDARELPWQQALELPSVGCARRRLLAAALLAGHARRRVGGVPAADRRAGDRDRLRPIPR